MRAVVFALACVAGCGEPGSVLDAVPSGSLPDSVDSSAPDGSNGSAGTDGTSDSGLPSDTGDRPGTEDPDPPVSFSACGEAFQVGDRAAGTPDDPILVPAWPMVDRGTTVDASTDAFDTYDCAPGTLETGPEVLYRFTVDRPGSFRAELRELSGDVDLHLLQAPTVEEGHVEGCLARGHQRVSVESLPAGEYWLVLDSWSDGVDEHPGAYEVAFEWWEPGVWREVAVAEGLAWRTLRTPDDGGQTLQLLEVDLAGVREAAPALHPDCGTVSERAGELGALAGINGGYFGMSDCQSLDFLKAADTVLSTNRLNGLPQRAMGWSEDGSLQHTWVDVGADWPAVRDAISGYPSLVTAGVAAAEAEPGVSVYSSTDWSPHPRSALGITEDNTLLLVTVAGRSAAGQGLTTPRLAEWMRDLGAVDAVGLDGGGSTTLFVEGCWVDGVVSHPSDNGLPDWRGARTVADGVYLY